jgi:hypothetical protein
MCIPQRSVAGALGLVLLLAGPAATQTFESVGTRAQGMGGAFVGIADDASAVYWNPAGLAKGAYFSLLLDASHSDAVPGDLDRTAADRAGWLLALSTPALGLSYYRLQSTVARPAVPSSEQAPFRLESLVTHHAGVTLVQSLLDSLAVGATVKLVRGTAGVGPAPGDDPEAVLDSWEILGRSETTADVDLGILATGSVGSLGLTVRNLSEPAFSVSDTEEMRLERQVRAGASILLLQSWRLAADLDLTSTQGPFGEVRELAIGSEGRLTSRITARGGVRFNTAGERGRTPAVSAGASFAVRGSIFVDGQVTAGSDDTFAGWGLAGRLMF